MLSELYRSNWPSPWLVLCGSPWSNAMKTQVHASATAHTRLSEAISRGNQAARRGKGWWEINQISQGFLGPDVVIQLTTFSCLLIGLLFIWCCIKPAVFISDFYLISDQRVFLLDKIQCVADQRKFVTLHYTLSLSRWSSISSNYNCDTWILNASSNKHTLNSNDNLRKRILT